MSESELIFNDNRYSKEEIGKSNLKNRRSALGKTTKVQGFHGAKIMTTKYPLKPGTANKPMTAVNVLHRIKSQQNMRPYTSQTQPFFQTQTSMFDTVNDMNKQHDKYGRELNPGMFFAA